MELYQNCHCLISLSFYEGFGLPVLEALKYGKPCIVTKNSAQSEIAGMAGLEVNILCNNDLLHAMSSICTNQKLYSQLKKAALKRKKDFSLHAAVEELEIIINSLT